MDSAIGKNRTNKLPTVYLNLFLIVALLVLCIVILRFIFPWACRGLPKIVDTIEVLGFSLPATLLGIQTPLSTVFSVSEFNSDTIVEIRQCLNGMDFYDTRVVVTWKDGVVCEFLLACDANRMWSNCFTLGPSNSANVIDIQYRGFPLVIVDAQDRIVRGPANNRLFLLNETQKQPGE